MFNFAKLPAGACRKKDIVQRVEIGVYRTLLNDAVAKSNCVEFIAKLFSDVNDKEALRHMNREKDLVKRGDIKWEITPPTDTDSYNGWWVSIYNEINLIMSRASEADLKQITVVKTPPPASTAVSMPANTWTAQEMVSARTTPIYVSTVVPSSRYRETSAIQSTGDRVYVRGYYRGNGTYVNSYTRSYPSHHR